MGTLTKHAMDYVRGRRERGELERRTARNLDHYLSGLDRSFGNRPIERFGPAAIDRWLTTTRHLSPATRRNHLGAVRRFCRWMVKQGLIPRDPTDHVPPIPQPRSVPRALPNTDVGRLLAAVPDQRARTIVALMVGCGLRCVEVSRLCVEDYDPDVRTISVVGKGGHERILPVPEFVVAELTRHLGEVGVVAGPMVRAGRFPFGPLSPGTISSYLSRWMAASGVKLRAWDGRSAHALRHTALSDVLDTCHNVRVVQEMAGHRHLSTTEIYLRRASLAQMREAMEGRSYRDAA